MAFPTNFAGKPLFRALALSVALHGLLLWPSPPPVLLPGVPAGGDGFQARLKPSFASDTTARRQPKPAGRPAATGGARRAGQLPASGAASGRSTSNSDESSATPEAGVDAEELRAYRLALAVQARPHWRYPEDALRRGSAGTSYVRVARLPGGGVLVRLDRSSGHDSLDGAAVEMLQSAVRSAAVPDRLRERTFSLVVPVVFELPSSAGR